MGTLRMLFFLLLFSHLCLAMEVNAAPFLQLNDEVLGLLVFKSDAIDPFSHLSSWNEDDDSPCSWAHIKCNPLTLHVSELSLEGLSLSGKIGRGLEKLQNLKTLSLAKNNFSGRISPLLFLSPHLETLDLRENSISGSVPPSLVNMNKLRYMDLSDNLFSGLIPDSLFQNCLSLQHLSLSGNLLQGPFPAALYSCSSLSYLNLSNNLLSGNPDFSTGLWRLNSLRRIDLSNNRLSGSVSGGLAGLTYLKEMQFQGNKFTGTLPYDIGLCPYLNRLDFSSNLLSGSLPFSMGDLKLLSFMSLSNNKLTGEIPFSLAYCTNLLVIRLRGNGFEGIIPPNIFDMELREVDFSHNRLSGSIPPGSTKLFESLLSLDLSSNYLTGSIPAEMGLFSKLAYLNLSWNNLESQLLPEFGLSQKLTVLDIHGNALYGSIPEEISNCSSLYMLSLSHNNLSGPIPKSISLLKQLKILRLEFNQLSGEVPQQLGKLENLMNLNLSHNRLIGRLPIGGIFPSLDQSSLEENSGICSPLLKKPCKMNVPKPLALDPLMGDHNGRKASSRSVIFRRHRVLSISATISISAVSLIALGVIIVSLLNASSRRQHASVRSDSESARSSSPGFTDLTTGKLILFHSKSPRDWVSNPEVLLAKAAELGGGVFGTVHNMVPLMLDGEIVAIKRLSAPNTIHSLEDFDREIRTLGEARHENLIALKGYLWTPQLQLLVTEYAPRGSLHSRLHERTPSMAPFSWENRFRILTGTAKGLAYLHNSFHPPIVHYNLNPTNILLDENLDPKISDYGLEEHVISNGFRSSLGYAAPELTRRGPRVDEKCDVFSFGILILGLVTGKRPVEYEEDNVVILSDHVNVQLEQGNVLDCVDPSMDPYPEEEVLPVLKLALVCASQMPSSRPSMAEIVQILQVIKTSISPRMEVV